MGTHNEPLNAATISSILAEKGRIPRVRLFNITDSTNLQARKMASEGAPHGTVVIANEQTAGRGRHGRSFFSPADSGLYLSLIVRPEEALSDPVFYTIMAGVSVCQALESLTKLRPRIKWVNDIYLGHRKVCGILSEAQLNPEKQFVESVVIGIGINISTAEMEFPEELRAKAASLNLPELSRNHLAADIIDTLLAFTEHMPTDLMDQYRSRSLLIGKEISFLVSNVPMQGVVTGIDDAGHLLVQTNQGSLELHSGEVTIRSFEHDL